MTKTKTITTKVWLITGSTRGLGRALAEAVLAAGHNLVATGRNPAQLKDLVARYGGRVRAITLDVTSEQGATSAVAEAMKAFGRLDVVANNAGYGDIGPIEDTSLAEFRAQIETNLFGVISVTKAALPFMREQGSGHILQFSSVGGRIGPIGRGAYAAAKWGVEGFSEVLSKEVGPLGVKVTIIELGGFRTNFAGSSTTIREGRPEYDATVGKIARFQRDFNGKQPGDPAKAAAAVLRITSIDNPPLRLILGSDAFQAIEQNDLAMLNSDRQWKELSLSTDFMPSVGQAATGVADYSGTPNQDVTVEGTKLAYRTLGNRSDVPPKERRKQK
jgi:NAD(P)-dependent dehydrogenase (short-subunit alcohol dehydrogenase family)